MLGNLGKSGKSGDGNPGTDGTFTVVRRMETGLVIAGNYQKTSGPSLSFVVPEFPKNWRPGHAFGYLFCGPSCVFGLRVGCSCEFGVDAAGSTVSPFASNS